MRHGEKQDASSDESLSTPGSSEYILPDTSYISATPVSVYTWNSEVCLHRLCIFIHLMSPIQSPSSLFLCTPAVTQSSAKLNGGGGSDEQIILPQLFPGSLCDALLSAFV
jgi:hypothetical protein